MLNKPAVFIPANLPLLIQTRPCEVPLQIYTFGVFRGSLVCISFPQKKGVAIQKTAGLLSCYSKHLKFNIIAMTTLITAISLFISGIVILYVIGRRRFNRRGVAGLETFSSYGMAVFIRLLEALFRLLAWAMILVGAFLGAIAWYNS